jgi:DinB superfamily
MNLERFTTQLEANLVVFGALNLPPELWRWKPARDRWSALEVMGHLADEERLDFRFRLESLLTDSPPGARWVQQDAKDWIAGYALREPAACLEDFRSERRASMIWLRSLTDPDWTRRHASSGCSAGDLMLSWVAHDDLHLKQLLRLRYDYLILEGAPYDTAYAGEW